MLTQFESRSPTQFTTSKTVTALPSPPRVSANRYRLLISSLVCLCFLIGAFAFAREVSAATYYVDCNAANDNGAGTSAETAWKTIAKANSISFVAGDVVQFTRGCTWAETLTPKTSGNEGNPILFSAYGSGALPKILGGTQGLLVSSKNHLSFQYLDFAKLVNLAGTDLVLSHCLIRNSNGHGVYVNTGSTVRIDHSAITSAALYGLDIFGSTTLHNSVVAGNGRSSYGNIQVQPSGTLDYDYNILVGGGTVWGVGTGVGVSAGGTATNGGHNLQQIPEFYSYDNNDAHFVLTSDDSDVDYWEDLASTLPSGTHFTMFLVFDQLLKGEAARVATLAASDNEVASHTYHHNNVTATTAFSLTSTNANPTIAIDRETKTLTLHTDTPGNSVTLDWSMSNLSKADLQSAVAGKGWTLSYDAQVYGLWLKALADSSGPQAVPYSALFDQTAYLESEINDSIAEITSITDSVPITLSYPWGVNNNEVQAYLRDLGVTGARGTYQSVGTENNPTRYLSSVDLYNVQTISSGMWVGDGSEASIRAAARNLYVFAKSQGMIVSLLVHKATEATAQQVNWLVDEIQRAGGQWETFGQVMTDIRTDHSTTDGMTYTKSYADAGDFRLTDRSPAIDSGTITPGITTDILGNPIYGAPDIGAYEYQPPHTVGTDKIDVAAGARIYEDGKFRDLGTATAQLADLTITPASGSFRSFAPTAARPEMLDVTGLTWSTTGDHHKAWAETSASSTLVTLHAVGDLEANKYYAVTVDGVVGQSITGTNCSSGVCQADGQGKITFAYTGGYSTHTFDVTEAVTYTIGGALSGLSGAVVLQNNGGDDLTLSADGDFTFTTPVADGSGYAVTVLTQPPGQTCTVSNGPGTLSGANVTGVSISCSNNPDITSPTVAITNPASGYVSGTVSLTADASDDIGVAGVQFKLDDSTLVAAEDTTAPYTASWNTTAVSDGTHTLVVVARDWAGNYATSTPVTVTVDNTNPTLSISAPSASGTKSGSVTYTLTYGGATAVTLAPDDITLNRTGTADGTIDVSGSGLSTRTVTVSGITGDGMLGITISLGTAADDAGHHDAGAASQIFAVDNTAPSVSITAPTDGATVSGTVPLTATASDASELSSIQFLLDGTTLGSAGSTSPFTYSWDASALSGTHILAVQAADIYGNSATSPTITVTVDNAALATAPGAPTNVSATAGDGQAAVTFTAPASDGGSAITGYTVTSNTAGGVDADAGSTALSHTVTGLTNGTSYTFTVTATNAVGTGPASASSNSVTPMAPSHHSGGGGGGGSSSQQSSTLSVSELQATIASLLAKVADLQAQIARLGGSPSGTLITAALAPGSRGAQVTALQQFLIDHGYLASGNATSFYGPLTTAAVQAFQRAHGIVSSGSPAKTGYGAVGPKTRAAINATAAPQNATAPVASHPSSSFGSFGTSTAATSQPATTQPNIGSQMQTMQDMLSALTRGSSTTSAR